MERPFKNKRPLGPFFNRNNVSASTSGDPHKLVGMLQDAHTSEAESVVNYVSISYVLQGPYAEKLGEHFRYAANDEFDHLHKFSAMIATVADDNNIDVAPLTSVHMNMVQDGLNPSRSGKLSTEQAAAAAEALEQSAKGSYPDIADYAQTVGYPQFADVIDEILKDESHHHNLFKQTRQSIGKSSTNSSSHQTSIPRDWKSQDYGNKD